MMQITQMIKICKYCNFQLCQAQIKPIIMALSTLIAFPVYRKAFIQVMTPLQTKHKRLINVIAARKWTLQNKIDCLNRI